MVQRRCREKKNSRAGRDGISGLSRALAGVGYVQLNCRKMAGKKGQDKYFISLILCRAGGIKGLHVLGCAIIY